MYVHLKLEPEVVAALLISAALSNAVACSITTEDHDRAYFAEEMGDSEGCWPRQTPSWTVCAGSTASRTRA